MQLIRTHTLVIRKPENVSCPWNRHKKDKKQEQVERSDCLLYSSHTYVAAIHILFWVTEYSNVDGKSYVRTTIQTQTPNDHANGIYTTRFTSMIPFYWAKYHCPMHLF